MRPGLLTRFRLQILRIFPALSGQQLDDAFVLCFDLVNVFPNLRQFLSLLPCEAVLNQSPLRFRNRRGQWAIEVMLP